jgi:hypothetical protein
MPTEGAGGPRWRAGLELYDLAASGGLAHRLVERRLDVLNEMLASDPLSVLDFIPLTTVGADGMRVIVVIRDDLSANLALAANDFELVGHKPSGDVQ